MNCPQDDNTGKHYGSGASIYVPTNIVSALGTNGIFIISLLDIFPAQITWEAVAGAASYVLIPLGTNRAQQVTGTRATDYLGGQTTCYLVATILSSGAVGGVSDVVCAIPGSAVGL